MTDARFPDRIGIGDGPMVPCRIVPTGITPPDFSAIREDIQRLRPSIGPDGVFRLDRIEATGAQQLTPEQVAAWLAGMAPAFQALREHMQRTMQALGVALRPLAEFIAQHPELLTAEPEPATRGCHHWCGRWPAHSCAGEATGTLAYRPGGREVPMCDGCRDVTVTHQPRALLPTSDRDWTERGSTCAHVCGPDPGHCCDARATVSITHPLPSGGTRTLPLCGPCHQAETVGATVAS